MGSREFYKRYHSGEFPGPDAIRWATAYEILLELAPESAGEIDFIDDRVLSIA